MEPIAGFIEFLLPDGTPQGLRLHNYTGSDIRQFQGQDYMLAGFGYSGSVADYNAANTQAQLVFMTSALTKSIAQQATDLGMLVRVFTVFLDPVTLDPTADFLSEIYTVTSSVDNLRTITLTLSSPLDAQGGELPARVLSQRIVGHLPATGAISFL